VIVPVMALLEDAVREFCARSPILSADDISVGLGGGSSSTVGRRYRVAVHIVHAPTGIELTVETEQAGGHTRSEVRAEAARLAGEALPRLEAMVRSEIGDKRKGNATRRHG
jgi:hypothetical protein